MRNPNRTETIGTSETCASDVYADALARGLEAMREWARDKPELTDQVWELPKDCPLWAMGLSLAQADHILCAIHYERNAEKERSLKE